MLSEICQQVQCQVTSRSLKSHVINASHISPFIWLLLHGLSGWNFLQFRYNTIAKQYTDRSISLAKENVLTACSCHQELFQRSLSSAQLRISLPRVCFLPTQSYFLIYTTSLFLSPCWLFLVYIMLWTPLLGWNCKSTHQSKYMELIWI